MFGAPAESERDLIWERSRAGLETARGRRGGGPKALDPRKVATARALHADKANSIEDICTALCVSRSTPSRFLGTGAGRLGGDPDDI